MSLKRKASFSCENFRDRDFVMQGMEDVPRHLNSRTRKRFRDARPDEQTVYANTLRMLYQAQKEPIVSTPPDESTPPPSEPEAPDPRQQTLLKFFQPVPAQSSLPCDHINNNMKSVAGPAQLVMMELECNQSTASASGSSTPASTGTTEMDVNMDTDTNMDYSAQRRWVSSIRCM